MRMESALCVTDNIDEILVKIIRFTRLWHEILLDNIHNIHRSGFTPKRLDSEGFAELMDNALTEHISHNRLLWSDNQTIRFERGGDFKVEAIIDEQAHKLFEINIEQYLQKQKQQLIENSLNNKVAVELLKQKQRVAQTMS